MTKPYHRYSVVSSVAWQSVGVGCRCRSEQGMHAFIAMFWFITRNIRVKCKTFQTQDTIGSEQLSESTGVEGVGVLQLHLPHVVHEQPGHLEGVRCRMRLWRGLITFMASVDSSSRSPSPIPT